MSKKPLFPLVVAAICLLAAYALADAPSASPPPPPAPACPAPAAG